MTDAGHGTGLPTVTMVWAQARDRVIGDGRGMPWRVPADMAHFVETTTPGICIMGRATWDGIPPRFRPFEGRHTIVCTRDSEWADDPANAGADRAGGVAEALQMAGTGGVPVYICGGGQIYAAAMPYATSCVVTEIDADAPGDVRAPELDPAEWQQVEVGEWLTDERSRVDGWGGPVRHRYSRWEKGGREWP